MIAWPLYATLAGAVLALLGPAVWARCVALAVSLFSLGCALWALAWAPAAGAPARVVSEPWLPTWGIRFELAADGVSLAMVLVTAVTSVAAVLLSWNVGRRAGEYFCWLLLVVGGSYGVFLSADLFLFLVFYEMVIVPKFLLIAGWGSQGRDYGAMKLALYSFFGGVLLLVPAIAAAVLARSTAWGVLAAHAFPAEFQAWAFPVMFLGFAVLAGLWPVHTWAPTGHAAAPTAGSMLLAGVVMKLGAFGALRWPMQLFPEGFGMWRGWFGALAAAGILLAALVALRQWDLKRVIGYSSVAHMGFVLLGLAAGTGAAVSGAVLQMFSHAVVAGLLFGVAGRLLYERAGTRDLRELSAGPVWRALPFAAAVFALGTGASMGLPGLSGFPAEALVLVGTWGEWPWLAGVALLGVVVAAVFSIRAMKLSFFGDDPGVAAPRGWAGVTAPEVLGVALLLAASFWAGLAPGVLLGRIQPSVEAMRCLIR